MQRHERGRAGSAAPHSFPMPCQLRAATGHRKTVLLKPVNNSVFYTAKCALRGSARVRLARLSR